MTIMNSVRKNLAWLYRPIKQYYFSRIHRKDASRLDRLSLNPQGGPRIYYLGITAHSNLGDMAQHYCITRWINDNYPDCDLIMFESDTVVDERSGFLEKLKRIYRKQDIIVFQSGYCTQDLGGNHPLMHRLVCDCLPDAHILMMPQTIFFQHEENKRICAENHNKAKNMLFLARDSVSYEMAQKMFPNIHVKAFPDIVTTLIGTFHFDNHREGVCICTRNDDEKLYSADQIDKLASRFEIDGIQVCQKDTQAMLSVASIRANLRGVIEAEIESYSHFKVTITDRYHGTIFSLCAGTPVIIIKTKDHKVTTGADWFKGIYDDFVNVADTLEDAYLKAQSYIKDERTHIIKPYFKDNYYDQLKGYFEEI